MAIDERDKEKYEMKVAEVSELLERINELEADNASMVEQIEGLETEVGQLKDIIDGIRHDANY